MGYAKAAELNGYPGPLHVLELADELSLTDAQRRETQAVFDSMKQKAVDLGRALVDEEARLDRLFAQKEANAEALDAALLRIGELQARVRGVHLEAHLAQARILSPEQVERYLKLRRYGRSDHSRHHGFRDACSSRGNAAGFPV
jgi:Spy/CpxP family protein refolding chaperone